MILLDNSMFDDGSIECKNFFLATPDETLVFEWDGVQKRFPDLSKTIAQCVKGGGRHFTLMYKGELCELQWD